MSRPILLWLRLAASIVGACALTACTSVVVANRAISAKGDSTGELVSLPNGAEAMAGIPEDALTSEARLLSVDGTRVCLDVVLRTWQGAAPAWSVTVESDGEASEPADWSPSECRFARCLPADAGFPVHPTDEREDVNAIGDRLCVDATRPPRHSLRLVARQGIGRLAFEWPVR